MPKPEATVAGALKVNVSVHPARAAEDVEDDVWEDWVEVVADGALAGLLGMTNQAWSNPQKGFLHGERFDQGVRRARGQQVRSYARDDKTVGRVRAYD
jgi:hypothetical protein